MDAGLEILYSAAAFISTENPVYIMEAVLNTAGTTAYCVGMNRQIEETMEQNELIRQEMMQETRSFSLYTSYNPNIRRRPRYFDCRSSGDSSLPLGRVVAVRRGSLDISW